MELGESISWHVIWLSAGTILILILSFYYFSQRSEDRIKRLIRERLDSHNGLLRDPLPSGQHYKKLIVLIHGYQSGPQYLHHMVRAIIDSRELSDAQVLIFKYNARRYSTDRLWHVTFALYQQLNQLFSPFHQTHLSLHCATKEEACQTEIILVGHSVGALIARKILVFAHGHGEPIPDTMHAPESAPWGKCITRLVLLAGMTRGWDLGSKPDHMPMVRLLWYKALIKIARILFKDLLIFDAEKGAPFISDLRLQWFQICQNPPIQGMKESQDPPARRMPAVIQILGKYDDFIRARDHLDVQAGPFFLWMAGAAGHYDIISFRPAKFWKRLVNADRYNNNDWKKRCPLFLDALTKSEDHLRNDLAPTTSIKRIRSVHNLVIALHGIRDNGVWAHRLRTLGEERDLASLNLTDRDSTEYQTTRTFECKINAYDRLSMLEFIFSRDRRRAARSLMDTYTECRFKYPNEDLKIHFVGHSNGTYGIGEALNAYSKCNFCRIVLAGSVLPEDYDWEEKFDANRFVAVKNYIAKDDWIVALFPKGLRLTRWPWLKKDIGGAGFDGFNQDRARYKTVLLNGKHGAVTTRKTDPAKPDDNIDYIYNSMLDFLLQGTHTDVPEVMKMEKSTNVLETLSNLAWMIWYAIVIGLPFLGWLFVMAWGCIQQWITGNNNLPPTWWLLPSILYVLLIRKVLKTI